VTYTGEDLSPAWSSDGHHPAYISRRNADRDVRVVDATAATTTPWPPTAPVSAG
jgi:hypothetical protein